MEFSGYICFVFARTKHVEITRILLDGDGGLFKGFIEEATRSGKALFSE